MKKVFETSRAGGHKSALVSEPEIESMIIDFGRTCMDDFEVFGGVHK